MTGKRTRQSGEEPEMTFEAPDTVPLEAVEDDNPKRKTRDLGAVAVGTAGFAASSQIEPDATRAAMDDAEQPFDDSLDIFDTLQPTDAPDAVPDELASPDPAVLSSIYGAESTAGGGFNLPEPDPDLDFSPIDFTIAESQLAAPDPTLDITTGATSFAGSGQPPLELPEPPPFLDDPLDTDAAELDVIEDGDDDDDGEDDMGGDF